MGVEVPLGVILVGGQSSRMGSNKALVAIDGIPMHRRVGHALAAAGCEVVMAGATSPTAKADGHRVFPDPPGAVVGPIAGLRGVAAHAAFRRVVLVATDQPLVRTSTIARMLLEDAPVVAPVDDGIIQVTCAVYRPSQLGSLLETAPSLQVVARAVDAKLVQPDEWRAWGEDGRSWYSVDTPAAVAVAESWPEPA